MKTSIKILVAGLTPKHVLGDLRTFLISIDNILCDLKQKRNTFFREEVTLALTGFHGGSSIHVELEFEDVDFCGGRKTRDTGEKPSEQGENQQETRPIYTAPGRNRKWATSVGGKRFHHCAIPFSKIDEIIVI